MSFFIDPKLKQIGASEMKDWVIFGLIVGFLLLIQYNVTVSHNRDIDRLRVQVADIQADIEWLSAESAKVHTPTAPIPGVDPVVVAPKPPKPLVAAPHPLVKPPVQVQQPKVAKPHRRPMSDADMEFGCRLEDETPSGECR